MYKIVHKQILNPTVTRLDVAAPLIARKAKPGQFIMLRIDEAGERVPLTIADYDREQGTIAIIFQLVGKTTKALAEMDEGDELLDFVGPLGTASHLEGYKKVAVIGGGLGTAIAYPQAKALHQLGAEVDIIAGFRNKDLVILEDDMKVACTNLFITTDDGSYVRQGFVTDVLREKILEGRDYDLVIAIGPLIMMKMICNVTKEYNIHTIVSMNSIMVDGTGMCGGCRLTVGGETKFACIDGPDFDGHLVNFDEAMRRSQIYKAEEKQSEAVHICRLTGKEA
ncbi:MAG: sulfide/dihydroorotate dehydrogenase-like FAD/NAD-binding protein [Eubacteriales bacterium]|nr:sulfide/dihydroorotate dehydrogenase-like FAD/NAD-binding protein [Eubacteriales bacterium]